MAEAQSSILIVDDDAEDLAFVERTLRSLGSELISIKDPHEVMPKVHRHRPDVVILDALLPGLSGFDLCKQIKSDPQFKGTQVLILTGVYLRQQYRHEALQQFKADAFLTKPFRPPELQRLVVQLLSRKIRMPQSSFLKRIGLPASAEPRKKGLLGRIFGRGEGDEPETTRIAPVARDVPQTSSVEAVALRVEAAPELVVEPPREGAPPKPAGPPAVPEPSAIEAERKPVDAPPAEIAAASAAIEAPPEHAPPESSGPEPAPNLMRPPVSEAPPEPERVAVAAPEPPRNSEPPVPTDPPQEILDAESGAEPLEPPPAEGVDAEPPPSVLLDAAPPAEPETVHWVLADSRTQDMTLEQAASRVAKTPPPSAFEDLTGQSEVEAEREAPPAAESHPAADSSPTTRRPLFRVGEVPIYDEPDFLTELKRELSKCKRVDRPLTLILIRVGDLGQIIELFGRDFREPVLWHIAEQAMESLREVDLVGMMASKDRIAMTAFASDRYGGGRIVSRMRQAVTRKPFRVGEELPPIIPALDFGMATFPADGSEVANLMLRAEEDLTSAKDEAAGSD